MLDNFSKKTIIINNDVTKKSDNNIELLENNLFKASNYYAADFPEEFEDFLKMVSETRINNEEYNRLVEGYSKKYRRMNSYGK